MKRESFGSRLGFLLVSAGCAIGIGNVWRFPYITGKNGGGYFVLFYLICLLLLGVPVLTMELAVGRGSRKSAVLGYKALEKPGSKWHIHGWFCLIGCYLLMMYYTTVTGWMVNYFCKFLTGSFHAGMSTEEISGMFGTMLSSPGSMALFTEIVVVAGLIVCSFGLQKGLERVTKVMMLALLCLILVLAVHSLTLSGAAEGLQFYLLPSVDSIRANGLGSLITDAMNQAFFTLSLGIAAMEIFGSYMSEEHTLPGEAVRICALDTFVALMAGAIIFPAGQLLGDVVLVGDDLLEVDLHAVHFHADVLALILDVLHQLGAVEQALGWDAADIQAGAAQMLFFNQGDFRAQLGRPDGGHIAAGAAADNNDLHSRLSSQAKIISGWRM